MEWTNSSRPLYWGVTGLVVLFLTCLMPAGERAANLVFAALLFGGSILAWLKPRQERWLTLAVGAAIMCYSSFSLWRYGFSWLISFAVLAGVAEIIASLFFWPDERNEDEWNAEDTGPGRKRRDPSRRRKRKRIADLIAQGEDDGLTSLVFKRIVQRYGEDLDVTDLKEHERVFLLAYDAWGIIGNGGFNYLFERSIRGDPHFALTAATFEAIGCHAAVEAFHSVFHLFPNGKPPEDVGLRLQLYRRGTGEKRHAIDTQFWDAGKEIESRLLSYIRAHAEEFVELDQPPREGRPVKKRKRRQRTSENEGPRAGDLIGSLPHWARVAFAARCGRCVWPFFTACWPNALPKRSQAVTGALELAERSAASARPADGLEDAVMEAMLAAGSAICAMYGFSFDEADPEPLPTDGNAATTASFIANTAVKAAEAANGSPTESLQRAVEALNFALSVARRDAELEEALWHDLTRMERVARRGGWTDETPVPPDVWDLLE